MRIAVRRFVVVASLTVAGCGSARAPDAARSLAPFDQPWDPDRPVDANALRTKRVYAVAETALCPTRDGAERRACGNTVESSQEGQHISVGQLVIVLDEEPFDGHRRALRFQVGGVLPSWIRADDVADAPLDRALAAFEQREDVRGATDVTGMSLAAFGKLAPGTLVAWHRQRHVQFGSTQTSTPAPASDLGFTIFLPIGRNTVIGEGFEDPAAAYLNHHSCLAEDGCLRLDYECAKPHCDEVSVLARVEGRTTSTAHITDEENELPAAWSRTSFRVVRILAIADRHGSFELAR